MLTYRIAKFKATPDLYTDKAAILKRNIENNNLLRAGDRVRFKKPKGKGVYGKIIDIMDDPDKVIWSHGGLVPMNVVVEVDTIDKTTGLMYGTIVKTNAKKLLYVGNP